MKEADCDIVTCDEKCAWSRGWETLL